MGNNLQIQISAIDQASQVLAKVSGEMAKLNGATEKTRAPMRGLNDIVGQVNAPFAKFNSIMAAIPAMAAVVAIKKVADAFMGLIKGAAEAELASKRLSVALSLQGAEGYFGNLDSLASKLQTLTGMDDEATKSAMALGMQLGINAGEMENATMVAADLSAALGMDMSSAMRMLAQAGEGNTIMLKRQLPALRNINLEGKSAAEIYKIIGDHVKGTAEAMGTTGTAAMERFKNTLGDLGQSIGGVFLPAFKSLTNALTPYIAKLAEGIRLQNEAKNIGAMASLVDVETLLFKYSAEITKIKLSLMDALKPYQEEVATAQALLNLAEKTAALYPGQAFYQNRVAEAKERLEKAQRELSVQEEIYNQKLKDQTAELEKQTAQLRMRQKILQQLLENAETTTTTTTTTNTTQQETTSNMQTQVGLAQAQLDKMLEIMEAAGKIQHIWYVIVGELSTAVALSGEVAKQSSGGTSGVSGNTASTGGASSTPQPKKEEDNTSIFNQLLQQTGLNFESLNGFIVSVISQTDAFATLLSLVNPILDAVDMILTPIVESAMPMFIGALKILIPALDLVSRPFIFLAEIAGWLGEKITALGQVIWYSLTFQWNKIKQIDWGATFEEMITGAWEEFIAPLEDASELTTTSVTNQGSSATYTQARAITINQYFYTQYVVGEDGFRQFAVEVYNEAKSALALAGA